MKVEKMKIILIRHAEVLMESSSNISMDEMQKWIEKYNYSLVNTVDLPNSDVIDLIKNSNAILASSLSRTTDSLKMIDVVPVEQHSLFNEVDLPEAKGVFLKFHPKIWLVLLRLIMLLRVGTGNKILSDSKQRAK